MPIDKVVLPDGTTRKLGNLMPVKSHAHRWDVFGADPTTAKLIPRDQWDGLLAKYDSNDEFDPNVQYVHDQDGVGQCNCDATAALQEFVRSRQGLPFVKLSAADLYDRINGGADNGSMLEDAIKEMMDNGIGTAATSPLVWKRGMKEAGAAERAKFKVLEAYLCPTFDHVFSAVLQGFGVVSGIPWYDSYNPDKDFWLPRGTSNVGGHAIFGYKPTSRAGKYGIWHQNSWGTGWGKNGRFVIPEVAYSGQVGGWWAARAVTDEGV